MKAPLDLEIPLGKRTPSYRFFEMVPAFISYGMIIALVVLSFISPLWAAIYLLAVIITMIVKAVGMAYHSIVGHNRMARAKNIDWHERLSQLETPKESFAIIHGNRSTGYDYDIHKDNLRLMAADPDSYPKPSEIVNLVIVAAYNEPYEVIQPTMQAVISSTHDSKNMVLVFAYEERGGEGIKETVFRLKREYEKHFRAFIPIMHPKDLPDEVIGKGPNITYAAQQMESWLDEQKIDYDNVIVTTLDCDNKPHRLYFDYVTYEYIVHPNRKRLSYQPIALYFNNIWDAPAPARIIAIGNSFWTVISSMRPHVLRNFAAHSQPMSALSEMNYWSKRTIVEDGHQFWRSYFYFSGDYSVVPIHVPVYQDAVLADDFRSTLVAQFKQLRRWAYGASDVPYAATRILSRKRNVPLLDGLGKFIRLLEGHVSLATFALLVAFGAWVPLLVNPDAAQSITAHSLPEFVSYLQRGAMFGLFVTIILSLNLLPPRPPRYKKTRSVAMVLQWVLMPVTAIVYNAFTSWYSQTRLMMGNYLDVFDVTEKAVKSDSKPDEETQSKTKTKTKISK